MIYCVVFFICSFELLFLVITVILLVKAAQGRMLDHITVTDYKIRKDENREKQKENPFRKIY